MRANEIRKYTLIYEQFNKIINELTTITKYCSIYCIVGNNKFMFNSREDIVYFLQQLEKELKFQKQQGEKT